MKPGQVAQLQELSKCVMTKYPSASRWVEQKLTEARWDAESGNDTRLSLYDKCALRYLVNQYRNQIAAMRKNRRK